MSMVEWKTFGSICDIKGRIGFRGYTRKDQVEKGEGAISLSPGNITDSTLNYNSCTYITWAKYDESPEIMAHNGDIILCKTASIGKVAMVENLPEKATINPQLVLIKNISPHVSPKFLFFVLDDYRFQNIIKALAGVGSVPNVSQAKLAEIQVPIPSLSEQNRIVGILDTFTESIDNLKQQIEQRKKQYEYYRDELLDLEGKDGVEWKPLDQVCSSNRGVRVIKKDLLESGSIPVYQNSLTSMGYYHKSNFDKPTPFVISAGAAGEVGYCDIPFWAADDCLCITCPSDIIPKFVYYFLVSKQFYLKTKVRKGAIPRLSRKVVEALNLPILPIDEQHSVVCKLDAFEASIANLEQQLSLRQKQYEYYRNKLLTFE